MPHLAGVLDDRKDDSCIHIDETMGFYYCSLEHDYEIYASRWFCGVLIDVDFPSENALLKSTSSMRIMVPVESRNT